MKFKQQEMNLIKELSNVFLERLDLMRRNILMSMFYCSFVIFLSLAFNSRYLYIGLAIVFLIVGVVIAIYEERKLHKIHAKSVERMRKILGVEKKSKSKRIKRGDKK